jgi:hypothetical protein
MEELTIAELDNRLSAVEETLEAMRADLQIARDRDIPLLKGTVRAILSTEIETINELPAAGAELGQHLGELDERVAQLDARLDVLRQHRDASTKAEKIATVLSFA